MTSPNHDNTITYRVAHAIGLEDLWSVRWNTKGTNFVFEVERASGQHHQLSIPAVLVERAADEMFDEETA